MGVVTPHHGRRRHTDSRGYNTDLQRCLDELQAKKGKIAADMESERALRAHHEEELRQLTEKLSRINDSLGRKVSARNEYDTTIQETEAAYLKILESSQTLDHVMKRQGK